MALAAALLPQLRSRRGRVVNITSDASVEAYETWGGYGSSKAALDHATRVLAAEEAGVRAYAVDPGDLRTALHQEAFPGEDISDRPEPASVVPALLVLVTGELPGGRYRARRPAAARGGTAGEHHPAPPLPAAPRPARPPSRPRPAAWPATRSGWRWPRREGPGHTTARTLPAAPAPRRPAGGQHQRHAAVGRRHRAPRRGRGRPRLHRPRRRQLGGRAARRARPRPGGARPRRGAPAPGGVRLRVARAAPGRPAPALADPPVAGGRPGGVPRRARPPDPVRLRRGRLADVVAPERLRHPPRQRRDAQRRAAP